MRCRVPPVAMVLAVALGGLAGGAGAGTVTRFDLDRCTWYAQNIVVATEGKSIDGRFAVIESWLGDLPPGTEIHVPRLAVYAPVEARKVREGFSVTGARMVLFVEQDENAQTWTSSRNGWGEEGSVCWIEGDEVFSISTELGRIVTGSPPAIRPLKLSERALRDHVLRLREAKRALARIRATADVEQRFAGAAKHVNDESRHVVEEAFDILGGCGKTGVPFLLSLLSQPGASPHEYLACAALGDIGDLSAVKPLVEMMEVEFTFWKEAKERLRPGWSRDWQAARADLRHFNRVTAVLWALQGIAAWESAEVVRRTRELWASTPVLREVESEGMLWRCDQTLRAISNDPRRAK